RPRRRDLRRALAARETRERGAVREEDPEPRAVPLGMEVAQRRRELEPEEDGPERVAVDDGDPHAGAALAPERGVARREAYGREADSRDRARRERAGESRTVDEGCSYELERRVRATAHGDVRELEE